jgi:phosphonoacetaldehyde hydrolase
MKLPATSLKAVIFDWAGTMVDFGSQAPTAVFVDAFRHFGVEIGVDDVRRPMGLPKRDHIAALLAMPHVARAWTEARGAPPVEADIDAVYAVFLPLGIDSVVNHAGLIPGAADVVAVLRERGLGIGSTTGYTRDIMTPLLPLAAAQGYAPDTVVCAGEVPASRPAPLAMYRCFVELGVWPAAACVKVDDTAPGIAEGVNAGSWCVGVTDSGNEVGLSWADWCRLSDGDRAARRATAADVLRAAGAHEVIDSVADLIPCLDRIEARLKRGEVP